MASRSGRSPYRCGHCGKAFKKGASIERIEWTRFNGIVHDGDRQGMDLGPSISVMWHSKCSKTFREEGGVLRRLDERLRKMATA